MKSSSRNPQSLTVLICTHNRVELLQRVIHSLNNANRPADWKIRIFVVANACSDGTHDFLQSYSNDTNTIPLQWVAEQTPGKSHALNRALPLLEDAFTAFVDDDHRVDPGYLCGIIEATRLWPDADMICGRIIPDWDGSEPQWVHDNGPHRIYPLPVPRYDQGDEPFGIDASGPIPGGGNIIARLDTIKATGPFSTELGPTGHDLGGSEDADWILRALRTGASVRYAPDVVQYHYVDNSRLTLSYIVRKGFERSRSVMKVRSNHDSVPLYMWRKVAGYAANLMFSTGLQKRRFYLVRLASSLGEISGIRHRTKQRAARASLPILPEDIGSYSLAAAGTGALAAAAIVGKHWFGEALLAACTVGILVSSLLVAKSARDFSRTGPKLRDEIFKRYHGYVIFALGRLALMAFAVASFWAFPGGIIWIAADETLSLNLPPWTTAIGAGFMLLGATIYAGCKALSLNPGLIIASWQYRTARVHRLWRALSARGLQMIARILGLSGILCVVVLATLRNHQGVVEDATALVLTAIGYASILAFAIWEPQGGARNPKRPHPVERPNVLMIGSDTLRADRIGAIRNGVSLTPNIDRLAGRGTLFKACYVPCARTAPSLISMLTGTWPHRHGVRDNFVTDDQTTLDCTTLPDILRQLGYRTAAVSDWCGADLGKFNFGFDILKLPVDQWNLKYLIRQGPKDIRLFLSIFLHNRIGRLLLPEIYYLGGVPQTTQLGKRGRRMISRLAANGDPFFLNLFYSTTHPPFASEHPYYVRYSAPAYKGESKFAMARLTEPFEIIRRQGEPREEFDLDQILDLYDGCVSQFDDEVGKALSHLDRCGLLENTLVVLYSDHGMEFFEHGTWGQGNSALGDFSARVPLIIAGPGSNEGLRVEQVVRSVDIMPTLLDILGAPSVKCDGVSLAQIIEQPDTELDLKAFNETGIWIAAVPGLPKQHLTYPDLLQLLDVPNDATGTLSIKKEFFERILRAKDRMVRDGRWKLVYQPLEDGEKLSLYDVVSDPDCRQDISAIHPDEVARLWAELSQWIHEDPSCPREITSRPSLDLQSH